MQSPGMKPEYEWRECVDCNATHIEECSHVVVAVGGKPEMPKECWKTDEIKLIAKDHHDVQGQTL